MSLAEQRRLIGGLIETSSAADAPTAYYALYHEARRSTLFVKQDDAGNPLGFVGRFQTGLDLFRPVIAMRCWRAEIAADLLAEALVAGRPYILFSNLNQLALTGGSLQIANERILSIYALDRARFLREINVLVRQERAPNGSPRAVIESNGTRAVAGVNWQSPSFAEIYVTVDPPARQKGWGYSVVVACAERILAEGRTPIYLVEPQNEASVRLAESTGFRDTGARQILADATYLGHPGKK